MNLSSAIVPIRDPTPTLRIRHVCWLPCYEKQLINEIPIKINENKTGAMRSTFFL